MKNSHKLKKRFALSLIEVMIALFVTGIIISFLWRAFFQTQKHIAIVEKKKNFALQNHFFYEKMARLLCLIPSKPGSSALFTHQETKNDPLTLFFFAERPVDPDPDFSGTCLQNIYLKGEDLCLATWANRDKGRFEVLKRHISSFSFTFYDSKEKKWMSVWPEDQSYLPVMIKIQIIENQQPQDFVFFPSQHIPAILYPVKKKS
jgi:hypothetical protein